MTFFLSVMIEKHAKKENKSHSQKSNTKITVTNCLE